MIDDFVEFNDEEEIAFQKIRDLRVDDYFVNILVKVHSIDSVVRKINLNINNNRGIRVNAQEQRGNIQQEYLNEEILGTVYNLTVYDETGSIFLQLLNTQYQKQIVLEDEIDVFDQSISQDSEEINQDEQQVKQNDTQQSIQVEQIIKPGALITITSAQCCLNEFDSKILRADFQNRYTQIAIYPNYI